MPPCDARTSAGTLVAAGLPDQVVAFFRGGERDGQLLVGHKARL